LGIAAVGCGDGGNAASTSPNSADDRPAKGSDQPPSNPDQPPPNSDQPPYNSDQSSGPPAPGGGGGGDAEAEATCRAFCEDVGSEMDDCPGAGANAIARSVCSGNCEITAELRPCLSKALELIDCLKGLDGLCTADAPSEAAAARCVTLGNDLDQCGDGDGEPVDPPPGGGSTCSQADQCASCDGVCDLCKCTLGNDDTTCASLCN